MEYRHEKRRQYALVIVKGIASPEAHKRIGFILVNEADRFLLDTLVVILLIV